MRTLFTNLAALCAAIALSTGCVGDIGNGQHEGRSVAERGSSPCKGKKCPMPDAGVESLDSGVVDASQPSCNRLSGKELLGNLNSWYSTEVAANGNFLTLNDSLDQANTYCLQSQVWDPAGAVVGQIPNCANVEDASSAMSVIAAPDGWYAHVIIPEIEMVALPDNFIRGGAAYDYSVIYLRPDGTIANHLQNLERSNGIWYDLAGDKNAAYLVYTWIGGNNLKVFALEGGAMRFLKDVPYTMGTFDRPTVIQFFVVEGKLFSDSYEYEDLGGGLTKVVLKVKEVYPDSTRQLTVASDIINTVGGQLRDRVFSVGGTLSMMQVFYSRYDNNLGHGVVSDMLFYDANNLLVRTLRPKNWVIDQLAPLGAGRWIGTLGVSATNWGIEHGSHVFLYDDAGNELDHLKYLDDGFGRLVNLRTIGTSAVVGRNMGWTSQVQPDGTVARIDNTGFLHYSCTQ